MTENEPTIPILVQHRTNCEKRSRHWDSPRQTAQRPAMHNCAPRMVNATCSKRYGDGLAENDRPKDHDRFERVRIAAGKDTRDKIVKCYFCFILTYYNIVLSYAHSKLCAAS